MSARLPGSYGVDAPYVPVLSAIGAVVFIGLAVAGSAPGVSFLMALVLLGQAGCYLHATRRGKFVIWRRIIDEMDMKGDEQLLDVGCGRGMVMLTAATSLPDGVVVGLDLWRGQDQTGNGPDAVMANADAVGVAEQVELHTGDMTEMPFVDGEFDVVVANVAIQNIKNRERRRTAIDEIVRVTAGRRPDRHRRHPVRRPVQGRPDGRRSRGRGRAQAGRRRLVRQPLLRQPPGHRHQARRLNRRHHHRHLPRPVSRSGSGQRSGKQSPRPSSARPVRSPSW